MTTASFFPLALDMLPYHIFLNTIRGNSIMVPVLMWHLFESSKFQTKGIECFKHRHDKL
jgi:hypothetical protein